jgi:hypothetical protein
VGAVLEQVSSKSLECPLMIHCIAPCGREVWQPNPCNRTPLWYMSYLTISHML